jgi:hypothetical protein
VQQALPLCDQALGIYMKNLDGNRPDVAISTLIKANV